MPNSRAFGGVMIVVAVVLGVVLALGLFQWETGARAEEARLNPSPTARPPAPTSTPTIPAVPTEVPSVAPAVAPIVAPTETSAPVPTDTVLAAALASTPTVAQPGAQSTPASTVTVASTLAATAVPATRTPTPAPAASMGGSPAMMAAGSKVFAANCNGCHPSANAGVGPALHGPAFTARYPDNGPLAAVIRRGRGAMPSFAASTMSDADLNAVVAYLRSLK